MKYAVQHYALTSKQEDLAVPHYRALTSCCGVGWLCTCESCIHNCRQIGSWRCQQLCSMDVVHCHRYLRACRACIDKLLSLVCRETIPQFSVQDATGSWRNAQRPLQIVGTERTNSLNSTQVPAGLSPSPGSCAILLH